MFDGNWFAVYTRSGREKKLSDLLTKKKIRNYFPLNKMFTEWNDRKKTFFEPLFPGYVFINISDKKQLALVQGITIANFVYWQGSPAVIQNDEIEAIQHFLREFSFARLEKTPVDINDHVRTINEPLMLRKGKVLEVRNNAVKMILPSLGQILVAENLNENIDSETYSEDSIIKSIIA